MPAPYSTIAPQPSYPAKPKSSSQSSNMSSTDESRTSSVSGTTVAEKDLPSYKESERKSDYAQNEPQEKLTLWKVMTKGHNRQYPKPK